MGLYGNLSKKSDDEISVNNKYARDTHIIFISLLRVLAFFVNVGSISGLGMSEDEDDNDKDVDGSENQEGTVKKCIKGASNSSYDDNDDDDNDSNSGDDDDDDGSDNEKGSVHSASDDKSEEDYSSAAEDDLDTSGNEDDDDDNDEALDDDAIQSFSATSLKEDLEKGKAAKNQLSKFMIK